MCRYITDLAFGAKCGICGAKGFDKSTPGEFETFLSQLIKLPKAKLPKDRKLCFRKFLRVSASSFLK
jgi:hypothetical protein